MSIYIQDPIFIGFMSHIFEFIITILSLRTQLFENRRYTLLSSFYMHIIVKYKIPMR